MTESYSLSGDSIPVMPLPHDCVIESIEVSDEYIVFRFEKNLYERASIQIVHPGADSLVIRYHLTDPCFYVYRQKKRRKRGEMPDYGYVEADEFPSMASHRLEYINHYAGHNGMIVKLWSEGEIVIDLRADIVEFEWTEK